LRLVYRFWVLNDIFIACAKLKLIQEPAIRRQAEHAHPCQMHCAGSPLKRLHAGSQKLRSGPALITFKSDFRHLLQSDTMRKLKHSILQMTLHIFREAFC